MDKIDLSIFFRTKTQANDFSNRLATLSKETYHTGFSMEKALTEQFGLEKKDTFMALLRDQKVAVESATGVKEFLDKLREKIAVTPLLPLTLAFEPKEETLKTLNDWFLLNLNKQVIFDITVDRSLIAGAAITFNGKFLDFSIKEKFQKVVSDLVNKTSALPSAANLPPARQTLENIHLGR